MRQKKKKTSSNKKVLKKWSGTRFCFIVSQFVHPPVEIITLLFHGETEGDVKRFLNKALATLPFRTLYSYVSENSTTKAKELLHSIEIQDVDDYPGAQTVVFLLKATFKHSHFLPRDPKTREFVDIAKQTKCLEILTKPCRGQKHIPGEFPF